MENKQSALEQNSTQTIDQNLLNACIHCGLCLPACPTYLATGRELESPRGRIHLLNLWQQNKIPFSSRVAEHLDSCLGCLGCQTACPSGVNYEAIFNQAKVQVNAVTPIWQKLPRYLALKWLLPNDKLLKDLGKLLRLWQQSGCDKFLRSFLARLNSMIHLPVINEILRWQSLLPQIPEHQELPRLMLGIAPERSAYIKEDRIERGNGGEEPSGSRLTECTRVEPRDEGEAALTNIVQFFKGCVMDILYNQVNRESLGLLKLSSQLVAVPKQTCCGALACHAGEKELARQLAKENIENYAYCEGPIIVTASGCAAMLKTYPELFERDKGWHEKAKAFSMRVQDLPEFLAKQQLHSSDLSYTSNLVKPITIAYHAACHLAHAQGIRVAPKELLENLATAVNKATGCQTVSLVPLIEEEYCCGSAGIYNLGHPILSEKILARKIEQIKMTGADTIVTTNPGCMLQLKAGIEAQGLNIQVSHLATLLAKAYLNSF